MTIIGGILVAIGIMLAFAGNVWILVLAFTESFLWGLGVILIPIVNLIFIILHIRDTWKPLLINIGGIFIMVVGFVILGFSEAKSRIKSADFAAPPPPEPTVSQPAFPSEPPLEQVRILGKNVVKNGDFSHKGKGWDRQVKNKKQMTVSIKSEPGDDHGRVLFIERRNSHNDGAYCGVIQKLGIPMSKVGQLVLEADLKPEAQSMPGTGNSGGEFPIGVRLKVKDGPREALWTIGLYIEGSNNYPFLFKAPKGQWTKIRKDLTGQFPDTATLEYIQVIGSGWDFSGRADNIALYAERKR